MNNCCNNLYPEMDMKRWETSCSVPYYTKSEIDEKLEDISISGGGITSGEVQTQIDASVEPIEGSVDALSGAVGQLSTDMENKADKSEIPSLENYYNKTEVNTIIEDNEYTISQAINDLNDRKLDASAYTPVDMSDYWTSGETQEAINAATSGTPSSATIERLRTDVNALSGDVTNLYETKLDASAYTPTDLSNYYNKSEVNNLLDDKLDASAYTPSDLSQYWTSAQTKNYVDNAISGITGITIDQNLNRNSTNAVANKAVVEGLDNITDMLLNKLSGEYTSTAEMMETYWTSAQTQSAITQAVSGKADASNVYNKTEVNNLISNKANVWCGDEASFNALTNKDANTIYLVY